MYQTASQVGFGFLASVNPILASVSDEDTLADNMTQLEAIGTVDHQNMMSLEELLNPMNETPTTDVVSTAEQIFKENQEAKADPEIVEPPPTHPEATKAISLMF